VELHTMQSVSQAAGTPHPALGCQLRFRPALFVFIRARPSRFGYNS